MGRKARTKHAQGGKGGPKMPPRPPIRRQTAWIVGVLLAVLVVGGGIGAWQWLTATPKPAPPFNLAASTGKRIALGDYVGKQAVVLLFYMGVG